MPLTASKIKSLKPKLGKDGKLSRETKFGDIKNLYLYLRVNKSGLAHIWVFRRYINGKVRMLELGSYPQISLDEARTKTLEINKIIDEGGDPWAIRASERFVERNGQAEDSFEIISREWLAVRKSDLSQEHQTKIVCSLERDVFPYIGNKSIAQISTRELLDIARRIENRGAIETAHRVVNRICEAFTYAMALEKVDNNPAISIGKLLRPVKSTSYAATVEPNDFRIILRKIYKYQGVNPAVVALLRLSTMIPSRPGELRQAKWQDIDLKHAEWRYHIDKTNVDHIVPLSRQAIAILNDLLLITGTSDYVFPSSRDFSRPLSDGTLKAAFVAMDIDTQNEQTPHGFRACFRTITDEVLGFEFPVIETQLAHNVQDASGRSYNRTQYLPQRKVLMQTWADYLDDLRESDDDVNQIALRHKRHS
ncbi:MAG: integrase arm-type DNA-binding domain-containing protein [Candidatus Riflebacteria bacterium]|nr:integrase arm-type DNA-binding domain-containing protein [Candidatus Riflebacteria bacterium]